jgi:hypothetical protein
MAVSGTGLLAGLASAIPGAIQGYQDMKSQDLKKMELEAKSKADSEDRKYKKLTAKLKAAELGQDLEENESGELVLKPRAGLLTPEQKRQEEMYMKGFTRDEKGNLKLADWKQQEIKNKGLLQQAQLDATMAKAANAKATTPKGSVGQQAVDRDFAKDYNEWTSGGAQGAKTEIQKLRNVAAALRNKEVTTGGLTGMFPDRMTSASLLRARSDVQSTIMNSLRAILGAAFTEKEGERVIKNTWNEGDSTENNLARVERLANDLEAKARDKDAKAKYYEQFGSLQGFQGITQGGQGLIPQERGLLPKQAAQTQPQTKVINGVTYRKVEGGWQAVE